MVELISAQETAQILQIAIRTLFLYNRDKYFKKKGFETIRLTGHNINNNTCLALLNGLKKYFNIIEGDW